MDSAVYWYSNIKKKHAAIMIQDCFAIDLTLSIPNKLDW